MICDLIWFVCFLSLSKGIENARVGYKSYQITNHGRFFLSHICHPIPAFRKLHIFNFEKKQKTT
jgi:hypothetical protein